MKIEAKIIADTYFKRGERITTMQLTYPRFIHSEFMTHRVFSRNSASSRAIPVDRLIAQVEESPAMPVYWGLNQAGMQAGAESSDVEQCKSAWLEARDSAVKHARHLQSLGLHKQVVNRVLEPFQLMQTVVTATDWGNFFDLRCHPDAQPEIRALAEAMKTALDESEPDFGMFHLPYITDDDLEPVADFVRRSPDAPELDKCDREELFQFLCMVSAARCARVSYLKHDGTEPSVEDDITLYNRLTSNEPIHASPLEHQAIVTVGERHRNLNGWMSFRAMYEKLRVKH